MKGLDLLRELKAQGVLITRRGEKLVVVAPTGVLTPDHLARLRSNKVDLLAALDESREPAEEAIIRWLVAVYLQSDQTDLDGVLTGPDGRRWPIWATVRRLIESWDRAQEDPACRERWFTEVREFHTVYTCSAVRWERLGAIDGPTWNGCTYPPHPATTRSPTSPRR